MAIRPEAFFLAGNLSGTLQQRIRQLVAEGIVAGRLATSTRCCPSRMQKTTTTRQWPLTSRGST